MFIDIFRTTGPSDTGRNVPETNDAPANPATSPIISSLSLAVLPISARSEAVTVGPIARSGADTVAITSRAPELSHGTTPAQLHGMTDAPPSYNEATELHVTKILNTLDNMR